MQLTDSRDIKASPEVVWAAILNPEVLKECVPGCESLTGSVEDGFEAVVAQKVGPGVGALYRDCEIVRHRRGQSLTITRRGQGRACGLCQGRRQSDA